MRICAGIDPGLDGGIAVLNESDTLETAFLPTMGEGKWRMINGRALTVWLGERDVTEAVIEEVHAMPKQGVSSTFKFGLSVGKVLGVLDACMIPYSFVTPQKWKKHYGLIGKDQDAGRRRAIEMFPRNAHQFARKMDVHRAEAALIARYQLGNGRWQT
jgi:crossover junction endodeoxyribonuclease RuvC